MPLEIAPGAPLQPLTLAQYEQMVEHGVLGEDDKVELLDGMLVAVSPQGEPHATAIEWLTDWACHEIERGRYRIRVQLPLRALPASAPEPDLALVPPGGSRAAHPSAAALVVEVAVSSVPVDLGLKRAIYARAGIGEYWVVRPERGDLRVHRALDGADYAVVEDVVEASFAGAVLRMAELPRPD